MSQVQNLHFIAVFIPDCDRTAVHDKSHDFILLDVTAYVMEL